MLDGKSKEVQHILEAVGGYHNIQEVKIFSPNGIILKSSKRGMIGRPVDPSVEKWFLDRTVQKTDQAAGRRHLFGAVPDRERRTLLSLPRFHCQTERHPCRWMSPWRRPRKRWKTSARPCSSGPSGSRPMLAISLSLFLTRFVTDPIQELIATMERAERGLEATRRGEKLRRYRQARRSVQFAPVEA